MAKARFTASAETDLLDLWLFIAEDNLLAADDAVDSIYRSAQLLAEQPMMGRARPELAAGLRSFPTQTPYILFHFPDDGGRNHRGACAPPCARHRGNWLLAVGTAISRHTRMHRHWTDFSSHFGGATASVISKPVAHPPFPHSHLQGFFI